MMARGVCCGVLGVVLLLSSGCTVQKMGEARAQGPSREDALQALSRIGVAGASQSAGFGAGMSLGKVLRQGVTSPHVMLEVPNMMFFRDPHGEGARQIDKLLQNNPTMTIAVDYLFWFVYGNKSEGARIEDLQRGFDYLERLPGPLFVGDIPDMQGAWEAMLPASAIPPPAELDRCNDLIYAWAAKHGRVSVIPLAEYVAAIKAETPVSIGRQTRVYTMKQVLNGDRLHGNKLGQVLLAALCIDAIQRHFAVLGSTELVLDVDVLRQRVLSPASASSEVGGRAQGR
ncbi:MAG: hypothetical protein AAF581_04135 [Planctomycetota bacterium]